MNKTPLIDSTILDGVSQTFEITREITVHAQGLEPGNEVEFWIVQITDPVTNHCACPPGQVVLPSVMDEVPLLCCGERVILTRDQPYVVLDGPQSVYLRAKLVETGGAPLTGPVTTQRIYYSETTTPGINDRLRGCPCTQET